MPDQPQAKSGSTSARIALDRNAGKLKLSGWAAPTAEGETELTLSLMAGATRLGTLRRDRQRPDVEKALGHSGPSAGFAIDDFGLAAFGALSGFSDFSIVATDGRGESVGEQLIVPPMPTSAPLGSRNGIAGSARLVDVWLESRRTLSLRFEGGARAARSVDAYQVLPGPDRVPVQVAAADGIGGPTSIVTFDLINPFLPVLLVFEGQDGAVDAIDIIPFPSLARGGWHAAERIIGGHGSDDLADMATMSAEMLRGFQQRLEQPADHVSKVRFSAAVETGLEPEMDEDLLLWLGGHLGLDLAIDRAPARPVPEFLSERIARYSGGSASGAELRLPDNSIPTIAALVSRLPATEREQAVTGGYAVTEWNRTGRIWSVWNPPLEEWLDELQPSTKGRTSPTLHLAGQSDAAGSLEAAFPGAPLAIVMRPPPTRVQPGPAYETAVELPVPLLQSPADPEEEEHVCAVVLFGEGKESPLPLLDSLASQHSVRLAQVIACVSAGESATELRSALQSLFPDRHHIAEHPARSSKLDQLTRVREIIDCETVLILDPATLLPDARTVATLLSMLKAPQVLTAGCLLRSSHDPATVLGAGYSIGGFDLRGTPTLAFQPVDPAALAQPATYPVVANSLSAILVRRSLLETLASLGSTLPEIEDVALGMHVIERGGLNLCTTVVSAYSGSARPRPVVHGVSLPYRLSPETVARIAEATVLVQRIR